MKKYLHIPLALLLIVLGIWGCTMNRPRPLISCFPSDDWVTVTGEHMVPGESRIDYLRITPDQLKETLDGTSVRPRSGISSWTCDIIFMVIEMENTSLAAEIGENGDIAIADLKDPQGSRTCWRAEDGSLYEALLALSVY